jgi:hypothetical protein
MIVVRDRSLLVLQRKPDPPTHRAIGVAAGMAAIPTALCFAWSFGSIPALFAGALFSTVIVVPVLYLARWREQRAAARAR